MGTRTQGIIHVCHIVQMLTKAGTEGKQIVFLFSDNQIKDESFVEDINMILNTGDVPNLYPPDEKADIIEKMQMIARTQVAYTLYIPLLPYTLYYLMPSITLCPLLPLSSITITLYYLIPSITLYPLLHYTLYYHYPLLPYTLCPK